MNERTDTIRAGDLTTDEENLHENRSGELFSQTRSEDGLLSGTSNSVLDANKTIDQNQVIQLMYAKLIGQGNLSTEELF